MSLSSSTHLMPVDPRIYCETINELHSYITSSKRGYLTQAELFRYYRQRHNNTEIPYRSLGYRSLLDLLSSDPRLFSLDLHREPAYVYSAVKLRQEKREHRRGNTSFSRQHHSTNTLDDQQLTPPDYVFFDHHIPLNVQFQHPQSFEVSDDHEPSLKDQVEHPSSTESQHQYKTKSWKFSPINDQISSMDERINNEEKYEETVPNISDSLTPLSPNCASSGIQKENHCQLIQRRQYSNDEENQNFSSAKDLTLLNPSTPRLNRSISTSTTSLTKPYSFHFIDLYVYFCTVVASFVFFAIILYKIC